MTKQEAGQLGGLSTFKKYGKKHMRKIGKLGATATWTLYKLVPVGTYNFAMVDKNTGEVKAFMIQWRM